MGVVNADRPTNEGMTIMNLSRDDNTDDEPPVVGDQWVASRQLDDSLLVELANVKRRLDAFEAKNVQLHKLEEENKRLQDVANKTISRPDPPNEENEKRIEQNIGYDGIAKDIDIAPRLKPLKSDKGPHFPGWRRRRRQQLLASASHNTHGAQSKRKGRVSTCSHIPTSIPTAASTLGSDRDEVLKAALRAASLDSIPIHIPRTICIPQELDSFSDDSGTSSHTETHTVLELDASAAKNPGTATYMQTYSPPLPEFDSGDKTSNCSTQMWSSFAAACTVFAPDCLLNWLLNKPSQDAKQAWREKVAICFCAVLASAFLIGMFGFAPLFFCRNSNMYTYQDIWAQEKGTWTVIYGNIYDMTEYVHKHPGGNKGIGDWMGKDSSKLFPRPPPASLPNKCLNQSKNTSNFMEMQCNDMSPLDELLLPCHAVSPNDVERWLDDYRAGSLAFEPTHIVNEDGASFNHIIIKDRVYNVTSYVNGLRNKFYTIEKDPKKSDNAYLAELLHFLITHKLNEDATEVYASLFGSDDYIDCLEELFYVGVIDSRYNETCNTLNILMYIVLVVVALTLVLQCLCSLLYLARPSRPFVKEDQMSSVLVMVPCYNEGDKELRKTICSVANTDYESTNKVMVVLADGNITGAGEECSTPETLANILGYEIDEKEDPAYHYTSIGALRDNLAHVYTGVYKSKLPYIVVVKCGVESERGGGRAGNRGKRDSQLIIAGMLNRLHHGRKLCELDSAISSALNSLQIPAHDIRYLMTIDADTRVAEDSINHMVRTMNKNERILALCGETRVDNKAQSWVTMIQVFEYYINHHMKKAFESVFGCVTCLPGCFTMYRVFSNDGRSLIADDNVFSEYSRNDIESLHEKNLYLLGEDRMLTTLLLKNFPDMRLSFVPEATCWTITPHIFSVLLSQRRRWTNSTFHNMLELLKVNTMCGICCFSMKTVVVFDLLTTMTLPAGILYAAYFIYLVIFTGEEMPLLMIILYGITITIQVITFLLRSRYDYIWWFLIFAIIGVPTMFLVIPMYSFWRMDDFGWGSTRLVSGGKAQPSQSNFISDSKCVDTVPVREAHSLRHSDSALQPAIEDDDFDDVGNSYKTTKTSALLQQLKEKENLLTKANYERKRQALFEAGIREALENKKDVKQVPGIV